MRRYRHWLLASMVIPSMLPAAAGDLPTAYSLFDRLFASSTAEGYQYQVPFPFEKLVEQIRQEVYDGSDDGLVTVMIPRGRSLQREAAKPDYYRFPRIVIALDRESPRPIAVKNRLFLGYQEKAEAIEIISYNEIEGRFEFQLVEDYAAGKTPRVSYASRRLCTSCHQNSSTIYARPLWRESNFNPQVAARLGEYQSSFHGISTDTHSGDSGRFDLATDQANLLGAYQQVWQKGCEASASAQINRACRAALFFAALQEALATVPRARYRSRLVDENLMPLLQQNWNSRWPQGMPVHSGDIDDRRAPLNSDIDLLPPQFDPISLRAPLAYWSYRSAALRSIAGLGENFILKTDLQALNDMLYRRAAKALLPAQAYKGGCDIDWPQEFAHDQWLGISCLLGKDGQEQFEISGELHLQAGGQISRQLSWLLIASQTHSVRVEVSGRLDPDTSQAQPLRLWKPFHQLAARLWDNRLLSHFTLRITPQQGSPPLSSVDFRLSNDIAMLEKAVLGLLDQSSSLFDAVPIDGIALMGALSSRLGHKPARTGLLAQPLGLPLSGPEDGTQPGLVEQLPPGSPLHIFFRYCASCHRGHQSMPPGFLLGDLEQVRARLRQCAPRIAYRLRMWHADGDKQLKSPMPPPASFRSSRVDLGWWRNSEDLRSLKRYLAGLLAESPQAIEDQGYDQLPDCINIAANTEN